MELTLDTFFKVTDLKSSTVIAGRKDLARGLLLVLAPLEREELCEVEERRGKNNISLDGGGGGRGGGGGGGAWVLGPGREKEKESIIELCSKSSNFILIERSSKSSNFNSSILHLVCSSVSR